MLHSFGGDWTDLKLQAVESYFEAYAKVLQNQSFRKLYVDAFAGTGTRIEGKVETHNDMLGEIGGSAEYQRVKVGSASIALRIEPHFDQYIFVEIKRSFARALSELTGEFPTRNVRIVNEEANAALVALASQTPWHTYPYVRAAIFIDPYGMQVDWTTLEALARTRAVDVALLFPSGPLTRMLTKDGDIPVDWQTRIDRVLGTSDWRVHFYATKQTSDLFDGIGQETIKVADPQRLLDFFITRLRTRFHWVLEDALPLRNSKGTVLYHLVFACANPRESAGKKFLSIARSVVRKATKR